MNVKEEVEQIAKAMHKRFMARMQAAGREDVKAVHGEDLMVPYEDLSEHIKTENYRSIIEEVIASSDDAGLYQAQAEVAESAEEDKKIDVAIAEAQGAPGELADDEDHVGHDMTENN